MKKLVLGVCALTLSAGMAMATEVVTGNLMDQGDHFTAPKIIHLVDVGLVCISQDKGNKWTSSCFTYAQLGAERLAVMGIEPNPDYPLN
ncbi:MAG: hypothetical protein VX730_06150 [Pseudomonadota bacterium]|nr:hypothetical protein [Pseudomonadota bacterium]